MTNPRGQATTWLMSRHPGAILYGVIITGAVLSATAGHETSARRVIATTVFVLAVYWLADLYVRAFAEQFTGGRRALSRRLREAAARESGVLFGGVPALAVVVGLTFAGSAVGLAVDVALWLTVVELAGVAYLGARHVGETVREAMFEAGLAALLGVVMVVAKTLLH